MEDQIEEMLEELINVIKEKIRVELEKEQKKGEENGIELAVEKFKNELPDFVLRLFEEHKVQLKSFTERSSLKEQVEEFKKNEGLILKINLKKKK